MSEPLTVDEFIERYIWPAVVRTERQREAEQDRSATAMTNVQGETIPSEGDDR